MCVPGRGSRDPGRDRCEGGRGAAGTGAGGAEGRGGAGASAVAGSRGGGGPRSRPAPACLRCTHVPALWKVAAHLGADEMMHNDRPPRGPLMNWGWLTRLGGPLVYTRDRESLAAEVGTAMRGGGLPVFTPLGSGVAQPGPSCPQVLSCPCSEALRGERGQPPARRML